MQRTVLVVDDSAVVRAVMAATLRLDGYAVVEACSGQDALAHLRGDIRFDAVITDLNMPGMDGFALSLHVRHNLVHRNVPIIVLTIESHASFKEQARLSGVTAFSTKPVDAEQLLRALDALVGRPAPLANAG